MGRNQKCSVTPYCHLIFIQFPQFFCSKPQSANKISIQRHLNKCFNSRLKYLLGVVQDWYKSVFRVEVPEPYPRTNGGQNIRRTRGPASSNQNINIWFVSFKRLQRGSEYQRSLTHKTFFWCWLFKIRYSQNFFKFCIHKVFCRLEVS